jgi:hypothetical protein
MESFNNLFISNKFNLFQNFIALLQAVYANILFLTSSKLFDFNVFQEPKSQTICKNISFNFSFLIKSGIEYIDIIELDNVSISNHISLKISLLFKIICNSSGVNLIFSGINNF